MAAQKRAQTLAKLTKDLSTPRLLTITVGSGDESIAFFIQPHLLAAISDKFQRLVDAPVQSVRYPEDDVEAWKVLIHWTSHRELPEIDEEDLRSEAFVLLLVRCWLLGEKHDISGFQDNAMLELLAVARWQEIPMSAVMLALSSTKAQSKLHELMTEVVACELQCSGDVNFVADLENCKGPKELVGDVLRKVCGDVLELGADQLLKMESRWADFMVGDGPGKHWVFRPIEERWQEEVGTRNGEE